MTIVFSQSKQVVFVDEVHPRTYHLNPRCPDLDLETAQQIPRVANARAQRRGCKACEEYKRNLND